MKINNSAKYLFYLTLLLKLFEKDLFQRLVFSFLIALVISLGFIEPYRSPFSLLSLLNVNVLPFTNFDISLNLFFNSYIFFI